MLRVVLVTVLAAALIGSVLYYALKRFDLAHERQREAQVSQALQQEAVAVSRAFASMSAVALVADVAQVQDALAGAWRSDNLADVMLIDHSDRVFAASHPDYVGLQIQDHQWRAIRAQNREALARDVPVPGQERLTVIEPIQDKGSTIAWARLTFVRSMPLAPLRTPQERLEQVGRLMAPVCVLLVAAIAMAMRLAASRIRRQIQSVVAEAMAEPSRVQEPERTFADDEARPDDDSRRAA